MGGATNILLVDDERQEYLLIGYLLSETQQNDYRLIWCHSADNAFDQMLKGECDVVLLDYHWRGTGTGSEFLRIAQQKGVRIPIIVMTDDMEPDVDRDAIREGASDYLVKGRIDSYLLERAIRYAIERKKIELTLDQLAHYDHLSGLPNRMLFKDRLHQAIAQANRDNSEFTLMYLDLDGFKHVNDTYGHDVGDELIRQTAERLKRCVRKSDTVARIGGDEFTLLLSNTGKTAQVASLADKLVASLVTPFAIDSRQVSVGCSIGIAIYPDAGKNPDQLQRNADLAMYQAKLQPSSCYRFFTDSLNQQVRLQLVFHNQLSEAINNNQLKLCYRPRIDLRTSMLKSVEAIPVWHHPERGLLWPPQFFPAAEEGGLLSLLNHWLINRLCLDLETLDEADVSIKVVVNISLKQLLCSKFIAYMCDRLKAQQLPGERLEIDLSKTLESGEIDQIKQSMHILSEHNITFGLNHFGSGLSSLMHLQKLPISTLKIDPQFIVDAPSSGDDASLVAAMINLGHSLNKVVVATGVDTATQHRLLKALSCDQAQGDYYVSPLDLTELLHYTEPQKTELQDADI